MQTVDQQDIKKDLNEIGLLYENSPESKQLAFKAALITFSERDKVDYWRAFRKRGGWKYAELTGKTPFAIIASAHNVLGFNYLTDAKK